MVTAHKFLQIYLVGSDHFSFAKVGVSSNPDSRLSDLQNGCPYPLKILFLSPPIDPGRCQTIERICLERFPATLPGREWLDAPIGYIKAEISNHLADESLFKRLRDLSLSFLKLLPQKYRGAVYDEEISQAIFRHGICAEVVFHSLRSIYGPDDAPSYGPIRRLCQETRTKFLDEAIRAALSVRKGAKKCA